jgi:hypothetical protein
MRTPTEYEIEHLLHYAVGYDPVAAKKYYEEHKQLKGRRKGSASPLTSPRRGASASDPRTGKTRAEIVKQARTRQRKELSAQIGRLEERFQKLTALIKEREAEERKANHKSKAKSERAAKEKDKPKSAADKAEAARDAKKYRDKNQQKLKGKGDDKKSGGSSGSKKKGAGKHTVSQLRSLRTKVRGQIAVAKQKLAAL